MSKNARGLTTLTAALIAALTIARVGAEFSLGSQYLNAENRGNEHVLLFKLPEPIPHRLQLEGAEPIQRQYNLDHESPYDQVHVDAGSPLDERHYGQLAPPHITEPHPQPYRQLSDEPTISLTIPVAAIPVDPYQQQSLQAAPLQQHPQLQQQSTLILLSTSPNGAPANEPTVSQGDLWTTSAARKPVLANHLLERQLGELLIQQQQQLHPLPLAQHLHQLTPSHIPLSLPPPPPPPPSMEPLAPAPELAPAQPHLWRDTLPASMNMPMGAGAHNQTAANGRDMAKVLARLAASSPELLFHLRNILKRASQPAPGTESPLNIYNSTSEHLPSANPPTDMSYGSEGQSSAGNQTVNGGGYFDSYPSSQNDSLTDKLLAHQNVSSHEEIKIPLFVFAMPRILSFKRNQQSSKGHNATLPLLASILRQSEHSTLPANLTQSSAASLLQWLTNQINNNNSTSGSAGQDTNSTSNIGTYVQYNLNGQQQSDSQAGAAPPSHPMLSPQQKMAPYARQFVIPLQAAPTLPQFVPAPSPELGPLTRAQLPLSLPFASQLKYEFQPSPANASHQPNSFLPPILLPFNASPPPAHLPGLPLVLPPVGQQSANGTGQTAADGAGGALYHQMQPQQQPQQQMTNSSYQIKVLPAPKILPVEQMQAQQRPLQTAANQQPEQRQRRLVLIAQRPANMSAETAEERIRSLLNKAHSQQRQQQKLSLLEGLSRFRPMFTSPNSGDGAADEQQRQKQMLLGRFTPSQMLSLIPKSTTERRSSRLLNRPAGSAGEEQSASGQRPMQMEPSKGGPKVVFMIV